MESTPTREDSIHDDPNREADSFGATTVGPSQPTSMGSNIDELRGMFQTLLHRVDNMQKDHNKFKEYVVNQLGSSSPRRRTEFQEGPAVGPHRTDTPQVQVRHMSVNDPLLPMPSHHPPLSL